MTPEFRMNLIRAQVPSLQQRRARYGSMVAYLAVTGALLAVAMGVATTWLIQAANERAELVKLDNGFAGAHAGEDGIVQHAAWLEKELTGRIALLKAVDRQLAGRSELGHLLYRLALSLPPDVMLRNMTLDAEGAVAFELLVPAQRAEAGLGPSDVMTQWNQDAALGGCLTGIAYISSQRQAGGERSDIVWRFSGHMIRKEL
jgi:hypothetical protein